MPLAGETPPQAMLQRLPRDEAMEARYWQPNPRARLGIIVCDCNREDPLDAVLAGRAPAPSAVVHNTASGHSHALYVLANPVSAGPRSRQAPIALLNAVWSGLETALSADTAYTKILSRGPFAPGHELEAVRAEPWRLHDLAAAVPLPRRGGVVPPAARDCTDGRNVTLFRRLREELRGWTSRHPDAEGLRAELEVVAALFQAELDGSHPEGRLPASEVRATVESVWKYGAANRHTQPRRPPQVAGAVDRSQIWSGDRPPVAPDAIQKAMQAAAGQLTAARRREATRAAICGALAVLQRGGQPITLAALGAITGLSRRTLQHHSDLFR